MDEKHFEVIVLGIVFNTETKKILIGKRKDNDSQKEMKGLTWAFPGGRPQVGEELEDSIKREVREETSLDVESMGVVFAKTYPEKRDLISIYYLCEIVNGEAKAGEDFEEIKWVAPEKLEKYFNISYHPKLKEYLEDLTNNDLK